MAGFVDLEPAQVRDRLEQTTGDAIDRVGGQGLVGEGGSIGPGHGISIGEVADYIQLLVAMVGRLIVPGYLR